MRDIGLPQKVVEFILSMDDKLLAETTETSISRIFRVKKSYLLKNFEEEQKLCLRNYILRERTYRAFFMIERDHEVSINEVVDTLGFAGHKEFNLEFKNLFLIDPQRYINLKDGTRNRVWRANNR